MFSMLFMSKIILLKKKIISKFQDILLVSGFLRPPLAVHPVGHLQLPPLLRDEAR